MGQYNKDRKECWETVGRDGNYILLVVDIWEYGKDSTRYKQGRDTRSIGLKRYDDLFWIV